MRTLTRPMFRMGGPIKEGVMHGIREPYKHGQRVMPTSDGSRPGYAGPLLLAAPAAWTAARAAAMRLAPRAFRGIKSLFGKTGPVTKTIPKQGPPFTIPTGRSLSSKGYPGGQVPGKTIGPGTTEVTEQIFKPNPMTKYLAGSPEGKAAKWIWDGKGWVAKAVAMPFKSPLTAGYLTYQGGKWLTSDGKEATDAEIEAYTKGPPGGGDKGMTSKKQPKVLSSEEREAFAKSQREARVNKYLDLMGYGKAQKNAAYDALIDASKIITDRGNLKGNVTGEVINPIIQATSKRLDKPQQIREAVGLMATKADIEKDIKQEENVLAKTLTQRRIDKLDQELGSGFEDDLRALVASRKEKVGKKQLERFARLTADKYGDTFTLVEDATVIGNEPGVYMVEDQIFRVDDDGQAKQIV